MKIPPRNIEGFVKKPPANALAVLVYGPDEGLVRERVNLMSRAAAPDDPFASVDIAAEQLQDQPSRLIDEARSISMFGGRRVVRVRDASDKITAAAKDALTALKDGDNFVLLAAGELGPRSSLRLLFEGAENAAALPCYVDDERDIGRVIAESLREGGWQISSDALTYMSANVVGDRAVARGEVEKLITYMGSGAKNITLDDITACVGSSASLPLDDLARAVASGQFADADRVLELILAEGIPAVTVLRVLQNYFLRLHITQSRLQRGEGLEAALARLRPPLFFKHKPAFESQAMNMGIGATEQALNIIISAEARTKQTGALPETIVSRAVLSLCQIASRAARRRA